MKRIIIQVITAVILIMTSFSAGCSGDSRIEELESDNNNLQAQVTVLETEKSELELKKSELETLIATLEDENTGLSGNLAAKISDIDKLNEDIDSYKDELATLQNELASVNRELDELVASSTLKNPTYEEALELARNYLSPGEEYDSHSTYTWKLLSYAKENGYRAYPVVVVMYYSRRILVFTGFETVDKGWLYLVPVPQILDQPITLEEDNYYEDLNPPITNVFGFSPEADDDRILKIMVFK